MPPGGTFLNQHIFPFPAFTFGRTLSARPLTSSVLRTLFWPSLCYIMLWLLAWHAWWRGATAGLGSWCVCVLCASLVTPGMTLLEFPFLSVCIIFFLHCVWLLGKGVFVTDLYNKLLIIEHQFTICGSFDFIYCVCVCVCARVCVRFAWCLCFRNGLREPEFGNGVGCIM